MLLVGQYDSPYVRRVAISLHALGMAFERNTMSVFSDAEAMRRINPLGRIPSLVLEGGEVLIDSAAILDHLDELAGPARALTPPRGVERRRALQIAALASGIIDKAGAVVYERTLRPPDKVHEPWIERCRAQLDSGLAALEQRAGSIWPAGEGLMQPAITTGCMMAYLRWRLPEAIPHGAVPGLERLAAACEASASFAAALPAQDEAMPGAPL
jgi:glutathione S-transferase